MFDYILGLVTQSPITDIFLRSLILCLLIYLKNEADLVSLVIIHYNSIDPHIRSRETVERCHFFFCPFFCTFYNFIIFYIFVICHLLTNGGGRYVSHM